MKRLIILFLTSVIFSTVLSQTIQIYYDEYGQPKELFYRESNEFKLIKLDHVPEDGSVRFKFGEQDISVDLNNLIHPPKQSPDWHDAIVREYEPGKEAEGDLISDMELSTDGKLVFVAHKHSGNIFVYNSETYETVAIINTTRGIIDIAVTDSYLYVCCRDSRRLYVINLSDFSVANHFPIDKNACELGLNTDESIVYVAFNSWLDGWVSGYDMETGEKLYSTHHPKIHAVGTTTNIVGRTLFNFHKMFPSPKGDIFISSTTLGNFPVVYDANTGDSITHLTWDNHQTAKFNETGDTLYLLTLNQLDELTLRRIECENYTVIDSLITLQDIYGMGKDMAINSDGSKILVADNFNMEYIVYDFAMGSSYQYVTEQLSSNPNIIMSPDKRYAFIEEYDTYQVFDMETNEKKGNLGYSFEFGNQACIATDNRRLFVSSIHLTHESKPTEGWFVFDYTNPDIVMLETAIVSGDSPEADVVTSAINSHGTSKLYTTNTFTQNLSIINVEGNHLEGTIDLPEPFEKITKIPKSQLVVLSGYDLDVVALYDPTTLRVVKDFDVSNVREVFTIEKGEYIYLFSNNGSHGKIHKIKVDGANSSIVDELAISYFKACSYYFLYSTENVDPRFTSAAMSPDGQYFVCGGEDVNTLDNYINIIETDSLEIVVSIPVGDACAWGYAFTSDSKRVCVLSNKVDKPIIYLDGGHSYLESEIPDDNLALSAQYSERDDMFYVLNIVNSYLKVNPATGEKVEKVIYSNNGKYSWQMALDHNDEPIIRQSNVIFHAGDYYLLPGVSKDFYYDESENLCIIPIPGPDAVCLFDPLKVSIDLFPVEAVSNTELNVAPNPANKEITITSNTPFRKVAILDVQGKLVYSGRFSNSKTTIPVHHFQPGVYFVSVSFGNQTESRKLVVSTR